LADDLNVLASTFFQNSRDYSLILCTVSGGKPYSFSKALKSLLPPVP
jgi:hypothetical protein